jgi:hypothetical protein
MSEVNKKSSSEGSSPAPKVSAKKAAPQATRKVAASPVAKKAPVAAKKAPVRRASAAPKPATSAPEKVKKPKMVRDSFSIPKAEYAVLDGLKLRAAKLSQPVKKTELLRAGIKVLAALSDTVFLAALKGVPSLKTGRPAKAKAAK